MDPRRLAQFAALDSDVGEYRESVEYYTGTPSGRSQLPYLRPPTAPLVNPIPQGEIVAPAAFVPPGQTPGVRAPEGVPGPHQVYEIGNSDYADVLRRNFALQGPTRFVLADQIVPVAAFLIEEDQGNAFYAGATITPAAGHFPMVRVTNNGTGLVVIDRLRINHSSQVSVTLSRPAPVLDEAVNALFLDGGNQGTLAIRQQSAAGGLVVYAPLHFTAEPEGIDVALGQVIRPGTDWLIFGSAAANVLNVGIHGREIP